jgi:F-type H+-transporting ATPase subunit b
MEILHQLGELFLEAVPTVVLVYLFYLFLRWSFFRPIEHVLAERSARIEGARAEAAAVQAEAQQEVGAYNEALKKARAEIYAAQEMERQAVLDERAKLLRAKRSEAQKRIAAAKEAITAELAAARAELEKQVPVLANEIVRAILERGPETLSGARR